MWVDTAFFAHIAFVTSSGSPEMTADDQLAAQLLEQNNIRVTPVAWDAPEIDWAEFDLIVIRSAWNFYLKPAGYLQWLNHLEASRIPLENPAPVIQKNLDKRYLFDLEKQGVSIIPAVHVAQNETQNENKELHSIMVSQGWNEVVIKPTIAASGYQVWKSVLDQSKKADQAKFNQALLHTSLLVQPLAPEIRSAGEWSLIFFDKKFSHAVIKKPASGDFRVQRKFGGSAAPATPARNLILQAEAVLEKIEAPLLYARVDAIERDGVLQLMELEINEPYLYLGMHPDAARNFSAAIMRAVTQATTPNRPCMRERVGVRTDLNHHLEHAEC